MLHPVFTGFFTTPTYTSSRHSEAARCSGESVQGESINQKKHIIGIDHKNFVFDFVVLVIRSSCHDQVKHIRNNFLLCFYCVRFFVARSQNWRFYPQTNCKNTLQLNNFCQERSWIWAGSEKKHISSKWNPKLWPHLKSLQIAIFNLHVISDSLKKHRFSFPRCRHEPSSSKPTSLPNGCESYWNAETRTPLNDKLPFWQKSS